MAPTEMAMVIDSVVYSKAYTKVDSGQKNTRDDCEKRLEKTTQKLRILRSDEQQSSETFITHNRFFCCSPKHRNYSKWK